MARTKRFSSQREYQTWWNEQNKERVREQKRKSYQKNKEAKARRANELKIRNRNNAIETLGGKCVDCGTTENLEFDHKVAGTGDIKICHILSSTQKLQEEIKKCELRCNQCHKARTIKQRELAWHLLSLIPLELQERYYESHPHNLHQIFSDTTQ